MDKSAIFKAANALAKSAHKTGDCYRVTFSVALKIIIKESKEQKMERKNVTVSMDFSAYNQRRFSKPWGALVTFNGTKAQYNFIGDFTGKHWDGEKGKVLIACKTGDLVAFGQKDGRGNSTYNEIYKVLADGTLQNISKADAYEYSKTIA